MPDKPLSPDEFENFDFRELPIGVYMTSIDGQFIVCNKTLRKMFGLPTSGPIHANIKQYYVNPRDRDEAVEKVMKADQAGNGSDKILVQFHTNGRDVFAEDFCKPLKDPNNGGVIGFVGCLVDISDEHENALREKELQRRVEELTIDIGSVLHSNTTTLVMVMQTLNSALQAFVPNPFMGDTVPSTDEIETVLTEHANHLADAIERVLQAGDEERRAKALPEAKWKILTNQIGALRDYKQRVPVAESRPVAMRVVAHEVGQICQSISPGLLAREILRSLQQAAWHLERVTTLIDVLRTRSAVLQMDYTLHSLREYITTDTRETLRRTRIPVERLIDDAISRLTAFAQSSRVEIEKADMIRVEVNVNTREVTRALGNLLHNAIKYTWRRDRVKAPWVTIRTRIHEGFIHIEFENWGVPVSREEIEHELVFKLGYRGKWSTDRGRLGTGIGLTDSRRVAQSYGGGVQIESHPARYVREDDPDLYKQPFITKVSFYLPVVK